MSEPPAPTEALEELTYSQAVTELEAILERIEVADIDVDTLSSAVERAAALLELCRARLRRAETRVVKILSDIDTADGEGEG